MGLQFHHDISSLASNAEETLTYKPNRVLIKRTCPSLETSTSFFEDLHCCTSSSDQRLTDMTQPCTICSTISSKCLKVFWFSRSGICWVSQLFQHSPWWILLFWTMLCLMIWGPSHASSLRSQRPLHGPPTRGVSFGRPNVLLILTDDQDLELGSMHVMEKTRRLMEQGGASFTNAFVTTPMCCPSRSSILTGKYAHNHNVYTNNENCSSRAWQAEHEPHTFAVHLRNAGYSTGFFGKYLNEYNGSYVPQGWRQWLGLVKNSRFYNYTLNRNGVKERHTFDYSKDYLTDLITNESINFFRRSRRAFPTQPILMVLSHVAPHGPEDVAPQYSTHFPNISSHITPSYNKAPNPDKHWILRYTGPMLPIHINFTNLLHRRRLQTLLSVDDSVHRICRELERAGELENTFVIYTSDHGYHLGQFGLVKGKSMPYEFDIRVPLYVRGPGVVPASVVPQIALNIDLAPTLLDMAGVETPQDMDGRSLLGLFKRPTLPRERFRSPHTRRTLQWRDTFLVERGKMRGKESRHEASLAKHPKAERVQELCTHPQYHTPCQQPGQQWHCVAGPTGRVRLQKCRGQLRRRTPQDRERRGAHRGIQRCSCSSSPNKHRWTTESSKDGIGHGQHSLHGGGLPWQFPRHRALRSTSLKINGDAFDFHLNDWDSDEEMGSGITPFSITITSRPFVTTLPSPTTSPSQNGSGVRYLMTAPSYPLQDTTPQNLPLSTGRPSGLHSRQQQAVWDKQAREYNLWDKHYEEYDMYDDHEHADDDDDYEEDPDDNIKEKEKKVDEELLQTSYYVIEETKMVQQTAGDQNTEHLTGSFEPIKPHGTPRLPEAKPTHKALWEDSTEHFENSELRQITYRCYSFSNNSVRCDDELYESMPAWKDHRLYVDNQIKSLQEKVTHLREVKGHLQRKKPEECFCDEKKQPRRSKHPRIERQKKKEGRKRKKQRKSDACSLPGLTCFAHDNDHWHTAPFWTNGNFCACTSSLNNTYWCLRTINKTHNILFCEFATGFIEYFDLNSDPYQLRNTAPKLSQDSLRNLRAALADLRACRGYKQCSPPQRQRHRGRKKGGRLDNHRLEEQRKWRRFLRRPNTQLLEKIWEGWEG
uniref:extracellular sulfatase Sulf-1-like n=1 Tax=Myxine glutinosa TaxID=7769 RepID=UPI00358FEE32